MAVSKISQLTLTGALGTRTWLATATVEQTAQGGSVTINFQQDSSGATPPVLPTSIILRCRIDASTNDIKTFTITPNLVSGTVTPLTFNFTSDGNVVSGGNGRFGTVNMRIEVAQTTGISTTQYSGNTDTSPADTPPTGYTFTVHQQGYIIGTTTATIIVGHTTIGIADTDTYAYPDSVKFRASMTGRAYDTAKTLTLSIGGVTTFAIAETSPSIYDKVFTNEIDTKYTKALTSRIAAISAVQNAALTGLPFTIIKNTYVDSSGNNHTGTNVGNPTLSAGSAGFGNRINTDGSNYVSVPNHADFDFNIPNWTIDCRMKTSVTTGYYLGVWSTASLSLSQWLLGFSDVTPFGRMVFYYINSSGVQVSVFSTNSFNDGIEHAIRVTKNGNNITVYIDGTSVITHTISNGIQSFPTTSLNIGSLPNYTSGAGSTDEVRISNIVRSDATSAPFVNDANTLFLMHFDDVASNAQTLTVDPRLTMVNVARTSALAIVNFGFHTVTGTFKVQTARAVNLNATTHGVFANLTVKSRDNTASTIQGTISNSLTPTGAPPELYSISWIYAGPTSPVNRGIGTGGDTAAHDLIGKAKGLRVFPLSDTGNTTDYTSTFVSLSDLIRLDPHPQKTNIVIPDADPFANPGSGESLSYTIGLDQVFAFVFAGDVNGVAINGLGLKVALFDPADNISSEGESNISTIGTGYNNAPPAFSVIAPVGNWKYRTRTDVDSTGALGNYGEAMVASGIIIVGTVLQSVAFISAYTANRAIVIQLTDEVDAGVIQTIVVEYINNVGVRLPLDAAPTIRIYKIDSTTGAQVDEMALIATTQIGTTDSYKVNWTPSANGVYNLEVRASKDGSGISATRLAIVRPRKEYDPTGLFS